MKASCNGCRVLRKGCDDDCSIRPCLQWIKGHEAQSNATLFLAKFYGRAGLLNLLSAAPQRQRPAVFRSLLYEACGRILNPTYGSVGLLWSGSWQLCQAAVDSVLKGSPIVQLASKSAADGIHLPMLQASNIRHVVKAEAGGALLGVASTSHPHFKRSGGSGVCPKWGQFYVSVENVASEENDGESMLTMEGSTGSAASESIYRGEGGDRDGGGGGGRGRGDEVHEEAKVNLELSLSL